MQGFGHVTLTAMILAKLPSEYRSDKTGSTWKYNVALARKFALRGSGPHATHLRPKIPRLATDIARPAPMMPFGKSGSTTSTLSEARRRNPADVELPESRRSHNSTGLSCRGKLVLILSDNKPNSHVAGKNITSLDRAVITDEGSDIA